MDQANTQPQDNEDVEADGYYGEDEASGDELDLSFLDEKDEDGHVSKKDE